MKYALVNGFREEATRSARGECPACGSEMIAKIYKDRVDHWAHKSMVNCDRWWENETIWHRQWKNCFDNEWQEIVHKDHVTGKFHIADVKTPHGWVIEFQHSPISDEERAIRSKFYNLIAWVVDGKRRKTDLKQLSSLLSTSIRLNTKQVTYAVDPNHKNRLLTEWHNGDSLVFFDYGQVDNSGQRILWFVLPTLDPKVATNPGFANDIFIKALPAGMFIESHINGVFSEFFESEIYDHVNAHCKELYNMKRRYKRERFPDPRLGWLGME